MSEHPLTKNSMHGWLWLMIFHITIAGGCATFGPFGACITATGCVDNIEVNSCGGGFLVNRSCPPGSRAGSDIDHIEPVTSMRLDGLLTEARDAGLTALADNLERALGPKKDWRERDANQAIALIEESIARSGTEVEPAYCRDAKLSDGITKLIVSCVKFNQCPKISNAQQFFATEDQYKSLLQWMAKTTVFFGDAGTTLGDANERKLTWFSQQYMRRAPRGSYFFVIGRASRVGNYGHNLELASTRAKGVQRYVERVAGLPQDVNTGRTAYSGYALYVRSDDGLLADEANQHTKSVAALNRSATVFIYACPRIVSQALDLAKGRH